MYSSRRRGKGFSRPGTSLFQHGLHCKQHPSTSLKHAHTQNSVGDHLQTMYLSSLKNTKPLFLFLKSEIHLYEVVDCVGEGQIITERCNSLEEQFNIREVHSCNVIEGTWNLYDGVNYTGTQYTVEEGVYPRPATWGASNPTVKSLKYNSE